MLLLGGFTARSLYLDRGDNDPSRQSTAPQMVWLDDPEAKAGVRAGLDDLLARIGERPAAVFGQCPAGGEGLYRHLRGLNMVLIPKELEGEAPPSGEDVPPEDPTHRLVLVRHADANVMARSLPMLTAFEAARLFGPARAILCRPAPEWSPGAMGLVWHPPDLGGAVSPGVLRFSAAMEEAVAYVVCRDAAKALTGGKAKQK